MCSCPGSSFLEKDGTFTNAERRISRVRKVMPPLAGNADWEVTCELSNALGYPMDYAHPSEIMDEIARLTPTFAGVSYDKLDRLGSVQWPCNDEAPDGTPIMHVGEFVRGKGRFLITEYVPTDEKAPAALPADPHHRAHPVAVQRRRADAPHRQRRVASPRTCSKSIRTTPRSAACATATGSGSAAAPARPRCARRSPNACRPASSTRPSTSQTSGANVVTTENSDWATNCPEYKVTAVQVMPTAGQGARPAARQGADSHPAAGR